MVHESVCSLYILRLKLVLVMALLPFAMLIDVSINTAQSAVENWKVSFDEVRDLMRTVKNRWTHG